MPVCCSIKICQAGASSSRYSTPLNRLMSRGERTGAKEADMIELPAKNYQGHTGTACAALFVNPLNKLGLLLVNDAAVVCRGKFQPGDQLGQPLLQRVLL